ncbi:hypothetical protein PtrSN002B_010399 [Pyrenophora tritici-repentis]|uniref:DUF7924 domain-containing protein n=2 Tax=Pyrenophora tritici-repentis TaxID=45151 RepID=A0A2W1FLW1_9PLEO|nr:uncharacterized protein PTRG_11791 [Pyrenophora tritici-repentis Pt-1C-BFP]KAF7574121.1 hypothetical protein PtrM4_057440 [Pyrenophora tritici-repentis]EDU45947.1 hypothetical protein PTRG_11791 [Pyrenophora tritici-repentis Pt-1C-BFP]KAG9387052.1 hypothetical protein A1F94_003802 [Pyrenophora tritici-repentis]KAI0572057.1 hypothetical protein Alg215_10015 [Pyrenophora tritici-repentis]KAI1508923.1 hypothetical protein Ptr86124_012222 [Pyrenophora tritici-repentis]
MKRHASDSEDTRQGSYRNACEAKRQMRRAGVSALTSDPSLQTLPLTKEALHSVQQRNLEQFESSTEYWVQNYTAVCDLEMMATPPTPRSSVPDGRGRRLKHYARSRGSRTPSPTKKPSPQTYRTRNMLHANVFVDHLDKLPPPIDEQVRGILGIESWENRVVASDEVQTKIDVDGLAVRLRTESLRNARECSLEGDWKASLNSLVRNLADLWKETLKTHMSEKVWNASLKPTGALHDEFPDEDYSGTCTPRSASALGSLPDFNLGATGTAATTFPGSIPSLPPYTQSVASTTSTDAGDPYYISTPKPDIVIGIAHTAFTLQHRRRLVDHQASGSILSDPHAADMAIRFPFLIVEAKGLSVNGTLISAQNQAAISGASMLRILNDLSNQAACSSSTDPGSEFISLSTTPLGLHPDLALCFSLVTEGPTHELWVHFMHEGAFHMVFLRSWRTTQEHDAQEIVYYLARIMEWGNGKFKDCIVEKLKKVPGHGVLG